MTNQFKNLDSIFPCVPNRTFGEVVGVSVTFAICGWGQFSKENGTISWKRKAWYVNASVNAFIMHRALCAELRKLSWFNDVPPAVQKKVKRLLAAAVMTSYLDNHQTGDQYHDFYLNLGWDGIGGMNLKSVFSTTYLYWCGTEARDFGSEWREVTLDKVPSK